MRRIVKAGLVVGACIVLTGCPTVKSVTGEVYIPKFTVVGQLPGMAPGIAQVGDSVQAGSRVTVSPGNSITLEVKGTDGKSCDLTYYADFTVVEPVDCKRQQEDNEKQKQDNPQQQQGQGQASTSGINGAPVPGSAGIGAPAVVPTAVPDYYRGGGGDGSAIGGPQVISTAAVNYTPNHLLATTTNLVEAIVGIIAVKKAGDKLDDNRNDKPVSP